MGAAATAPPPGPVLSFEALYAGTADDLHAYVAAIVRDAHLAEEVVATAFEAAFRRRAQFDPRRGSQRAWLYGIARNAALDELRRRSRRAALHHDPADEGAGSAEESARRATVRAALAGLDPADRELVALKFHGGLTNQEIAEVLGLSPTAAGSRLHRAVTKLREACA